MTTTTTIHLTHTGPLAGTPFCGVDRSTGLLLGVTFAHVPYTNAAAFLARPDICPACKAEWDAAGAPEALEAGPVPTPTDLYTTLRALGAELDHHASDLYVRATPEALAAVRASGQRYSTFRDNRTGQPWLDVPFAYAPHWQPAAELAQPFDYTVSDHGSLVLVRPTTDTAEAHLRASVGPEAQWFGGALAVEPRYLDALVAGLQDEGYTVAGGAL